MDPERPCIERRRSMSDYEWMDEMISTGEMRQKFYGYFDESEIVDQLLEVLENYSGKNENLSQIGSEFKKVMVSYMIQIAKQYKDHFDYRFDIGEI